MVRLGSRGAEGGAQHTPVVGKSTVEEVREPVVTRDLARGRALGRVRVGLAASGLGIPRPVVGARFGRGRGLSGVGRGLDTLSERAPVEEAALAVCAPDGVEEVAEEVAQVEESALLELRSGLSGEVGRSNGHVWRRGGRDDGGGECHRGEEVGGGELHGEV